MSEFLDWLVLLGPWSFFVLAWAGLTVCLLLALGVQIVLDRTALGHRARRWWCKRTSHVPISDERGRPVTAFNVCIRCGKILERIP